MDRRTFAKTVAIAPLAVSSSTEANVVSGNCPPNVIIMICDDLGYGDIHCYGSSLKTPNLDRMAAEGARLTRFNTAHPICSASRASLLTGRYANRSHTEGSYGPDSPVGMDLEEKTLADVLKSVNYKSMCIGKWHLGYPRAYLPRNRGFDSFFGVPWSVDMSPLPLMKDMAAIETDADRELLTPRYTEEAVKFIDASKNDSFFLYLAFSYPHDPPRSSPRFSGKSKLGHQGDAIEEIDWSVGEILEAVRRNGLDHDTIILFTSDHGPWFQGSPGYLRGRKATTFEGGTRVPFIARWRGKIPAGNTINEWASNLDVVPTIASICSAKLPEKRLDGLDISMLLTGKSLAVERGTMPYFAVSPQQQVLECARKGSWKLRVAQGTGEIYVNDWLGGSCGPKRHFLLPRPELYNLEIDPTESYDVATDFPHVVQEIQREIEALLPTFPDNVIKAYVDLKDNPGSPFTPPGAAPRADDVTPPKWIWIPKSRRKL